MIEGRPHFATWQTGTISGIVERTPAIKSFFFQLGEQFDHVAGQHVDIRLTAADGYTAIRSYSIASAPGASNVVELAIERLADGEVSPFFHDIAAIGDEIELRGPLGGHFIWPERPEGPVLLIGAGSGLAPLMAMIRHRRDSGQTVPTALLLSAGSLIDTLYADELAMIEGNDPGFHFALAITRDVAPRSQDFARRIDNEMVAAVVSRLPERPRHLFVCGSNGFVNAAVDGALAAGIEAAAIKTERYGG